ncbi:MAG: tetratricopeptide repeat protein [Gammaproteobacteria bacterium]|nr:tetratricopeptide repeat protein [Gammaproteobacteria bacterium]
MKNSCPLFFLVFFNAALIQGCANQVVTEPGQPEKAENSAVQVSPQPSVKTNKKTSRQKEIASELAKTATSDKQLTPSPDNSPIKSPVKSLDSDVLYHLLAGELAGQRGKLPESSAHYMEALRLSPDAAIAERATRIAIFARNDVSALEAAQSWVKLQPENMEAQQVAAALLLRTGNTEAAIAAFERILGDSVKSEQTGFMLVVSLLSKERDKKAAISVMDKLVVNRQNNPVALYAYSNLSLFIGELEKAESYIKKVLSIRPDWTEANLLYANILIRQERHTDALGVLKSKVADYPEDSQLRLFYARKLVDEKQYELAQKQFSIILDNQPEHIDALYALGLLSVQLKEFDKAQDSFAKLVSLGKRTDEAYYYLGEISERQKRFQDAIDYYKRVNKEPYYIEAQIRVAVLLANEGDIDQARDQLHRVNASTLEIELRLYLAEGEILRNAKQYEEAFDLYTTALQQMPGNARLLYARALIAEKFERVNIAIQDLELILKNASDNVEALNALGYTLIDRTDRLEEGLAYIERALAIKPDDPAILDSLGWAYYRMSKYDKALEYIQNAFTRMRDSEIASHLGEVLWVMGERDAARKVWDEALEQTPTHELLLKVIQRFTK